VGVADLYLIDVGGLFGQGTFVQRLCSVYRVRQGYIF
jgi:hypothetical protein